MSGLRLVGGLGPVGKALCLRVGFTPRGSRQPPRRAIVAEIDTGFAGELLCARATLWSYLSAPLSIDSPEDLKIRLPNRVEYETMLVNNCKAWVWPERSNQIWTPFPVELRRGAQHPKSHDNDSKFGRTLVGLAFLRAMRAELTLDYRTGSAGQFSILVPH